MTSFLPIIMIFKKITSQLPLLGNSFRNPVEVSIYSPIFRHLNQKRYLMSFLPIITMIFEKERRNYSYEVSFENPVGTSTYF